MVAFREGVKQHGLRTLEGERLWAELLRDLTTPVGIRKVTDSRRVSYKDRDYSARWAGDPDQDPRRSLPYPLPPVCIVKGRHICIEIDKDDMRMLHAYHRESGAHLGVLVCNKLALEYGRAVSEAEVAWDVALRAPERAAGVTSRKQATEAVRRRNLERDRKQTVRQRARDSHADERRRERPGTSDPATRRSTGTGATLAPSQTAWTPGSRTFNLPRVHLRDAEEGELAS